MRPLLFRISKISTFESNSQRPDDISGTGNSCSEYQRYQLLRAIHNRQRKVRGASLVVPNIKDINFWEQFTTKRIRGLLYIKLFRISKISTFESNSQQKVTILFRLQGCSEYQRYQLLRAIHNNIGEGALAHLVVPNIKDINFWEQFTT